jgi:hypothetical protein
MATTEKPARAGFFYGIAPQAPEPVAEIDNGGDAKE